jgi:DNA polymerase-3 subunit epsilon
MERATVTEFAANFTAIDFETANHRRDSACQLAAVKVRDGQIADSAMWMIRPKPFFFTRSNIRIHGITPEQVAEESDFGQLWDDIAATLGDDCLVAHNVGFDLGVMIACLKKHQQVIPEFQFTCTRVIARRTWPGRRRYGLKPLADWLGVRFQHHDALEDSIACAKVLLAAGIDKQTDSLPALEKKLRITRGTAGPWGYSGPSHRSRRSASGSASDARRGSRIDLPIQPAWVAESRAVYERAAASGASSSGVGAPKEAAEQIDLQRLLIRADFIRPLAGKHIVFAGRLDRLSEEHATLLASRSGGTCESAVNQQTNILVLGSAETTSESNADQQTSPQQQAQQLQQAGRPISILSEAEFLGLVIAQDPGEPQE